MDSVKRILWDDAQRAQMLTRCRRGAVAARLWPFNMLSINGHERCTSVQGECGCPHAEAILLVRALREVDEPQVLLSTLNPCTSCAHLIIASSVVNKVLFLQRYRDLRGISLLQDAGIETRQACDSDAL